MRRDHYDRYKSYSLEKAWELLIPPAEKRAAELREAVNDPERQDVKQQLEELLHGAEEIEDRFNEQLNEGLYVPDWMCDSDGFFIHMDRYYRDQIVGLEETIASLREMAPKVEELDVGKDEKTSIRAEIDNRIRKNQRFIKYNKTKIFEFKLKMNKKKQLHERKKKLDAEISKIEASRDGPETTKIIGG